MLVMRGIRVGTSYGFILRSYSTAREAGNKIVIIGGGTAGLAVASQLARANQHGVILDPSEFHYYQPGWTLVGAGLYKREDTQKPLAPLAPSQFPVTRARVVEIRPDTNDVITEAGDVIKYDSLVVAPGIQINWDSVKGLQGALGKDGVASNYSYDHVSKTEEFIEKFKGGKAIFTQPSTPIKCAGAPQKIMYLAEERWREKGLRDKTEVKFYSGMGSIFGVKKYADSLSEVCKTRQISTTFQHNLVEIKPESKEAVFATPDGKTIIEKYDFIHVTPPMSAPSFIKNSPLADKATGWVDVNKETMQHTKYPNIFALGDVTNAPKSRTAAAISQEAPVAVQNLLDYINKRPLSRRYNGYASCPLVTGKDKLILAEFDYAQSPTETFGQFIDQSKEQKSMYLLKRHILPPLYWYGLLKGRWNTFTKYELGK